jgi:hypothetical protein
MLDALLELRNDMQDHRIASLAVFLAGCGGLSGPAQGDAEPPVDARRDGAKEIDAGKDAIDGKDASGPSDSGTTDYDALIPCGDAPCGAGEICIRGRCGGCCSLPPSCIPMPTGCNGGSACGCFTKDPCGGCTTCQSVEADGIHCGNCMCVCSAPWTLIDTPDGPRRIADLRAGDLVYSVHRGRKTAVPLARVGRRAVFGHAVVRVTLQGGAVIEMSGGHPTADGRSFRDLAAGERLGDALIVGVESVPYDEPFTYDILPASDSGTYFSNGAWLGSTMFVNEASSVTQSGRSSRACLDDVGR